MNNQKRFISDDKSTKRNDFFKKIGTFNVEKIAYFLKINPEYLNLQDEKTGCTLLFRAVALGSFEVVEYLLDLKANPDIQNIYGETPLHQAVENGNYKIINILLDRGANPNIQQQV